MRKNPPAALNQAGQRSQRAIINTINTEMVILHIGQPGMFNHVYSKLKQLT